MAVNATLYGPPLGSSAGTIIDGTGQTSTIPITIKNAKAESGVELWYTGTVATGYDLMNASGTLKGGVAIAAAVNDWITGSAADDIIVHVGSGKKLLFGLKGGSASTVSIDPATATVLVSGAGGAAISAPTGFGRFQSVAATLDLYSSGAARFVTNDTVRANWTTTGALNYVAARVAFAKGADVAAASTTTLGADGNVFGITGTGTINYITTTNWQAGSEITLRFAAAATVNHNTGSVPGSTAAILLSGAANITFAANTILKLVYDGSNWIDVRKIA